jgi:hypothetical protein
LQQSNKLKTLAAYNFKIFGQFEEHLGSPQDELNLTSWQCRLHSSLPKSTWQSGFKMNVNLAFWQSGLGKQKRPIGKITEQKSIPNSRRKCQLFLYCPSHYVCDSRML